MHAEVETRLTAIDAKRAAALQRAVARADDAVRERDGLAAQLEAATERIRVLELQVFQREQGEGDADVELAPELYPPIVPPDSPPRSARRHGFSSSTEVQIDGEAGVLIDLSSTGAQVLGPTELEVDRIVTMTLPSDEVPVTCQGRVVWSRHEPQSRRRLLKYRSGILFTKADAETISAFIIRYATS
jgi:hypothetical protein